MSLSRFQRIVTAAVLAASLTVAGPVHAAPRWEAPAAADVLERVWQWLTGFLPGGSEGEARPDRAPLKRSGAIDPNGGSTGASLPQCASPAELERGGCIDPNG